MRLKDAVGALLIKSLVRLFLGRDLFIPYNVLFNGLMLVDNDFFSCAFIKNLFFVKDWLGSRIYYEDDD